MITAIVRDEDSSHLLESLVARGFPATKIGSTGGFLRRGNATFIIGVDAEEVPAVLAVIREVCRSHSELIQPPLGIEGGLATTPIEVKVGGAVVFVQNVERFEKT